MKQHIVSIKFRGKCYWSLVYCDKVTLEHAEALAAKVGIPIGCTYTMG